MGAAQAKHDKETVWDARKQYIQMSPDTRRRHYFCGSRFVKPDHIATWEQYYADNIDAPPIQTYRYTVNAQLNNQVALWAGDITECEVDAIVNSVCGLSRKKPGSVNDCVFERAGEYCKDELIYKGLPDRGLCNVIGGYKLPAKYVINAMAPHGRNEDVLAECYSNSLEAAVGHGFRTIAFPCIATNKSRGFRNVTAAHVALAAVRAWLEDNSDKIDMVVFCVFSEKDKEIYEELMQTYFPLERNQAQAAATADPEEDESPDPAMAEIGALSRMLFVNHILGQLGQVHVRINRVSRIGDDQSEAAGSAATDETESPQSTTSSSSGLPIARWQESSKIPFQVEVIFVNRSESIPILKRIQPIYDNPRIDLRKRPFIRYENEDGLDLGALSRDFFYKSLESLTLGQVGSAPAFEGDAGYRLPCASLVHSRNDVFELTGKILAHSVLHGGVGIIGLSPALVFLLSHCVQKTEVDISGIPVSMDDVPDVELIDLLRRADRMASMTDADRQMTHRDLLAAMERCNYGYTPITPATIPAIQQELILYEVVYKRWDQIEQLRAGMDVLDLYSFLCQNPSPANLTKVFPRPDDLKVTAADIKVKLNPQNSNHATFGFFIEFLDELQNDIDNLTLRDLLAFWTGNPILTSDPLNISVAEQKTLPVAHCCFNSLELPGALTSYRDFRDKFILALTEGSEGFNIE